MAGLDAPLLSRAVRDPLLAEDVTPEAAEPAPAAALNPLLTEEDVAGSKEMDGAYSRVPTNMEYMDLDPVKPGPALTVRAVVCGLIIGSLLCFSNMYFGLQTGFITMGSLQAAIVGFGVFRLAQTWGFCKDFSLEENVIIQTTSVATATMPLAAGMVGVLPAFSTMTPEQNPPDGPLIFSTGNLLLWSLALAFIGTFMAVPLRAQTIVREKLKFPSGTATANVIKTLHGNTLPARAQANGARDEENSPPALPESPPSKEASSVPSDEGGDESMPLTYESRRNRMRLMTHGQAEGLEGLAGLAEWTRTWVVLLWTFATSAIYTIISAYVPILQSWKFFDWFHFPAATPWGWEIAPAVGYVGQGMIMGPKTCASMLLGAIVGYGILGPYSRHAGFAPGPIGDVRTGATGWILWISLAIMLGDSFTSLSILVVTSIYKGVVKRASYGDDVDTTPSSTQVPTSFWVVGLIASIALCTAIMSPIMHMPVYEPIAASALAVLVAILAVRALGETDLNPVSGIGKLSQVIFAFIAPGKVVPNLVAGAIAEAGAAQAGDMMQDFKTAYLLGVSPRSQFWAMLIGSGASVFVSTAAYTLYTSAFTVPGPDFPAPTAAIWLDMAELVNGGHLPPHVVPFAGGAALIAAVIPIVASILEWYRDKRNAALEARGLPPPCFDLVSTALTLMPSGIAFAVGIYVSPKFTIPRVVGSILEQTWLRIHPDSHSKVMIVVASGFVLGEGTASIINAVVRAIQAAT